MDSQQHVSPWTHLNNRELDQPLDRDPKRNQASDKDIPSGRPPSVVETTSVSAYEDILSTKGDPALDLKMHLVNNAIEEIGWTPYHTKLFFLNGFGYAVDSLVLLLQAVVAPQAYLELGNGGYSPALTIAVYSGMLVGALFWGTGSDIFGRKYGFNFSLLICSTIAIIAGAMPTWSSLVACVALVGFGAGGNLILDTTVFLEYLPGKHQWMVTLLACWWGLGQSCSGLIAWIFLTKPEWNCDEMASNCPRASNMGWRFVWFTGGALVLVLSILRVAIISLRETPKYLVAAGKDVDVVGTLQYIATRYKKPCSITLESLQACGTVVSTHGRGGSKFSLEETLVHVKGLFGTSKKITLNTCLVLLSWAIIGLVYPLFYVFLPAYLQSRGAAFEETPNERWGYYTLTNVSSIFGPVLAACTCNTRLLGRRGTMAVGAVVTMAFFFAYTGVSTHSQLIGFSCAIGFWVNVYYGTLYAYTPEVMPSAHRATGNGISVACNRVMGIMSGVIGTIADKSSQVPIYLCAGLFGGLAVISFLLPLEPFGRRSS